ncbi:WD40 repeat-like protein [Rhizopogon salebrosus TDB-379]|nr:WD40 repeat-like protein [Rhizopogon salebrosus TDB-379]
MDESVQRWNADREMVEGTWTGHIDWVRSLPRSPIDGGPDDKAIVVRKEESGEVEVGPVKTNHDMVWSLAYAPSGDIIVSGVYDDTICIWGSKTGKLLIRQLKDLENRVSVVWSSDSSKLYSVSNKFARLWDIETYQPLHRWLFPREQDDQTLYCVLFSQDGRYLACGDESRKITLDDPRHRSPACNICSRCHLALTLVLSHFIPHLAHWNITLGRCYEALLHRWS